jgi:dTDP-4-amino-4,6-dideoxygalactose transaminase
VALPEHCVSNHWLNAILLSSREERDQFLTYTNDHGVMTRPAWELMHRLPMFVHCMHDGLTNSIDIADRLVNLPSSFRPSAT